MKLKKWPLIFIIPVLCLALVYFIYWERAVSDSSFFWQKFLISIFVTTTVWLADATFFEKVAQRFPDFKHTTKRLLITIGGFLILTFTIYSIDCFIVCRVIFNQPLYKNFIENIKITYVVTALVYVIYECIFFYHNWKKAIVYSEQLKKAHTIAQYESLKNQINPHFLFNSLNTLSAIIPQDSDRAVDFVQQLSSSYRYLLKMREKELVLLEEELEFVNSYLFLIKSRYGNNINISVSKDEMVCNLYLPPVSLQMLIENCIKHNVISKERPLYVEISILNGWIEVTNNLQIKHQIEPSTGLGLENIRKRYSIYSKDSLEIIKSETHFKVQLPLIKLEA